MGALTLIPKVTRRVDVSDPDALNYFQRLGIPTKEKIRQRSMKGKARGSAARLVRIVVDLSPAL